jgi:hypothetical protein
MTTPDSSLLKAAVDSALFGIGVVQNNDGTIDSDLAKVDEFQRRISRANSALVEYQCQARGQSRREK